MKIDERYLTALEAAEYLGVTRRSIYNYIKDEKKPLKVYRIKNGLKFKKEDLDEYVMG